MPIVSRTRPVISGLAFCFVTAALGYKKVSDEPLKQATDMMCRRIELMPRTLSIPLVFLTFIFDWYGFFISGRRFQDQVASRQQRQILQWKKSPLGPMREFIKFYEKMVIFIYYSLPDSVRIFYDDASDARKTIEL